MTHRVTITLENDTFGFLNDAGGHNKSAFVTQLLLAEKRRRLKHALMKANQEEADDAVYHQELATWNNTLADGLNR